MINIHVDLVDILFWVLLISLPLAVIYGRVKKISITLEEINEKMGDMPTKQPEIKSEEKENNDDINKFI